MPELPLDYFSGEHPQNRRQWRKGIPMALLWFGVLLSILSGNLSNIKFIPAFSGLAIATIISFKNWKKGQSILLVFSLIGVLDLLDFFPFTFKISFSGTSGLLGIDFLMLFITFLLLALNTKELSPGIRQFLHGSPTEIESKKATRINGFKRRFRHKTPEELEEIIENEKLVDEARKAAEYLLEQKQKI